VRGAALPWLRHSGAAVTWVCPQCVGCSGGVVWVCPAAVLLLNMLLTSEGTDARLVSKSPLLDRVSPARDLSQHGLQRR
jgi:hypothetical protein